MNEIAKLLSEINWFVFIVGALFLSILGNLLTGPVQNRLAKFSVNRSRRRVSELEAQLAEIEGF
jgi:multisubunit Na+/H+ antiporter MnhB subunit